MKGRLLLTLALALPPLAFARPASESPVAVAARMRQEAIKSVEFVFTVTETVEPGAWNVLGLGAPGGGPLPAQRVTRESKNRLVISGNRIRFENNHPIPSAQTNDFSKNIVLAVSDGTRQKQYVGPTTGADKKNSYGLLANPARGMIAQDTLELPMVLAARGYDSELSLSAYAKNLKPTGETLRVRDRKCTAYTWSAQRMTVWVDETVGHSPRRIQFVSRGGTTTTQLEVESAAEPSSGLFLPTSWKQTKYSDAGKLRTTLAVRVDEMHVNREYGADTFDLEFPPGIDVDDQRSQTHHRVQPDQSLVPLDSAGKPVGWLERNWVWLTCVTAACVLALVAVLSWRKVARRFRRQT